MNIFNNVALKPQDVLLGLKLLTREKQKSLDRPMTELSLSIGLSVGEGHNAGQRLKAAGLTYEIRDEVRVNTRRFLDFLVCGVPVVFYAERGEVSRGVPTAAFGPPLVDKLLIETDDIALVWPSSSGKRKGETLLPLYPTVVFAAEKDPDLYELLVLVDALRVGRARERKMATDILTKRLGGAKNEILPISEEKVA